MFDLRAGQQFAAGLGVATVLADFDFETYSEAGYQFVDGRWRRIRGANTQGMPVSVRAYVEHPSFALLSLYYDLKDGSGRHHWKPGDADPIRLFEHVRAGKLIEAHNSGFEYQVWQYYCVPRLGWPPLVSTQPRCSMAKARAHAYPGGLERLGEILNIEHKKIKDGDRLLRKFSQPRSPTKGNPSLRLKPEDDPEDAAKLYAYNERDILAESEVSIRCPDLSPFELDVWQLDQRINDRGVMVDMAAVENCIAIVEQAHEKYNAELWRLTGGAVAEASELPAMQSWLSTQNVPMYDMTQESVADMLTRLRGHAENNLGELGEFRNAYRVLEIREALGSASVKKLFSIRANKSSADRLHDLYSYYGSRTGRWTGNGPQPQNLYKGQFKTIEEIELCLSRIATRCLELVEWYYGDALEAVNGCLRSLFIARPGHKFISSDYAAIEGVVTAALSGEEWALEVFRTHGMIYEATASMITGIPFEEFVTHGRETGKHHPMRNKLGKFGVLASGFGGWIGAWKSFGADEYLSDEEIKTAILAWRAKSPNTVETWGGQTRDAFDWGKDPRPELFGLEGAAVRAIENPGQAYYGNRAQTIVLQVVNDCLYMRCPGGGLLTYHEPRLAESTRPYAQSWEKEISFMGYNTNPKKGPIGWVRMKIYGGLLMENAVQHVARYILAFAMLGLEAAGYPVVMHTHDEVVVEVPVGFGSVEDLERILSILPPDCAAWPIRARGGWEGPRYGKFD